MSEYNQILKQLLDISENAKNKIISDNMAYLAQAGQMPKSSSDILKTIMASQAVIFDYLIAVGADAVQDPEKPGFINITFEGSEYKVMKQSILTAKGYTQENSVQEQKTGPQPSVKKEEKTSDGRQDDISKTTPVQTEVKEPVHMPQAAASRPEDTVDKPLKKENTTPVKETETETEQEISPVPKEKMRNKEPSKALSSAASATLKEPDMGNKKENTVPDQDKESDIEKTGATIIGNEPVNNTEAIPPQEKRIPQDCLVYEHFKIRMLHTNQPGATEDIFDVICAPLKLSKKRTISTPIIVTFIQENTKDDYRIASSSYENDNGVNTITMKVRDYDILCRGTFDKNGHFTPLLQTTERSVERGDIIEVISHDSYGHNPSAETLNGHPVLHYQSDEGEAFVLALPVKQTGEDDFLVMSKTEEFTDYMFSSSEKYGAHYATVYENRYAKNVIPQWTDGMLELNIMEA